MFRVQKVLKGFFIIVIGMLTPVLYISSNNEHYRNTKVKVS